MAAAVSTAGATRRDFLLSGCFIGVPSPLLGTRRTPPGLEPGLVKNTGNFSGNLSVAPRHPPNAPFRRTGPECAVLRLISLGRISVTPAGVTYGDSGSAHAQIEKHP